MKRLLDLSCIRNIAGIDEIEGKWNSAAVTQGCNALARIRSPCHSNLDGAGHCRIRKHADRLKFLRQVRFVHFCSFGVVQRIVAAQKRVRQTAYAATATVAAMFGSAALSVFGTTLIQPNRTPGVGRPTPGRRKFSAPSTGCWILEQTGFQAASPPPASRMTRAVSAGWSQCGKWPLRSNQCSCAEGKAA